MTFATLFVEAGGVLENRPPSSTTNFEESKCSSIINLALNVFKRDTEKAALLRLKGYERADVERNTGKHSVVCRHWLKGMCMKGEFCDFLHQLVYSRMPVCRSYEKDGFCIDFLRGNCTFQHVNEQVEGARQASQAPSAPAQKELSFISDPTAFTHSFIAAIASVFPVSQDQLDFASVLSRLEADIGALGEDVGGRSQQHGSGQGSGLVSIPGLSGDSNVLFEKRRLKCFLVKSNSMMNIYYSICYGIWASGISNTVKFREAFHNYDHVILVFSGNESGGFQGYGKMMSPPIIGLYQGIWGRLSHKLGDSFRFKWIKQCTVDFDRVRHITNPLNNNLPLKKSRDGTELDLDVAEEICTTLYNSPTDQLLKGTPLNDWEKVDHETYFERLKEKGMLDSTVGLKFKPLP